MCVVLFHFVIDRLAFIGSWIIPHRMLLRLDSYVIGSKPEHGVPDMTVISDIDEFGINKNLQIRYQRDEIYVSEDKFSFCIF